MTTARTTEANESEANEPKPKTTERIDWSVPKKPWNELIEDLSQNKTSVKAYLRTELEQAMIEYVDLDASTEPAIDRLVEAAGRRPKDLEEDPITDDALANGDRVRVQKELDADVVNGFRARVQDSDDTYGVEFGKAIMKYLHDDRQSRMNRKVERVIDVGIEGLLEAASSNGDGLSSVEKTTIAIVNELPNVFDADDLDEAICKHAGHSDDPAKQTVRNYRDRVRNYFGDDIKRYEIEDEDVPDEYLPPKIWRQKVVGDAIDALGGDRIENTAPAFDRHKVCKALDACGIEVSEENKEQVNDLIEQLVDRLGFEYDETSDKFREPEEIDDEADDVDAELQELEESKAVDDTEDDVDTAPEPEPEPERSIEDERWFKETVESIVEADMDLVTLWESMDVGPARESIADKIASVQQEAETESVAPEEIDAVAEEIGLSFGQTPEATQPSAEKRVATDGGIVEE